MNGLVIGAYVIFQFKFSSSTSFIQDLQNNRDTVTRVFMDAEGHDVNIFLV